MGRLGQGEVYRQLTVRYPCPPKHWCRPTELQQVSWLRRGFLSPLTAAFHSPHIRDGSLAPLWLAGQRVSSRDPALQGHSMVAEGRGVQCAQLAVGGGKSGRVIVIQLVDPACVATSRLGSLWLLFS